MTDALDVLEPSGSSVTYRGELIDVKPLTIGQLPKLVRTARPVINAVLALQTLPDDADGDGFVDLLVGLVADHGEAIYQAAAICIGKTPEWVAGGDLDEFVVLAKALVEVNRDFFVQKLGPLLGSQGGSLLSGAGLTPSNS
jgi:hypothetical protein